MQVISKLVIVGAAFSILSGASIAPAFADNANWSTEKQAQVDANRNSDAGIGNGGERFNRGEWKATVQGEDGPQDVDPGNSGDNNNACPTPDGQTAATTDC